MAGQPGYDFGAHDAPDEWNGMGHSSQFRCVRVVPSPTGRSNEVGFDQVGSEWTLNACTAGGSHPPLSGLLRVATALRRLPPSAALSPASLRRMAQDQVFDLGPARAALGFEPRGFEPGST